MPEKIDTLADGFMWLGKHPDACEEFVRYSANYQNYCDYECAYSELLDCIRAIADTPTELRDEISEHTKEIKKLKKELRKWEAMVANKETEEDG